MATKLSLEQRRKRNREYQKKRREKIFTQPELKEDYLRNQRKKWKQSVEEGKIKQIKDLSERELRINRKKWRHSQRESRKKRLIDTEPLETPPDSPVNVLNEIPQTSREAAAGKRERDKRKQRRSREMKILKTNLSKAQKENNKLRKKIWRMKQKTTMGESPKTTTKRMMGSSNTSFPLVKKALLFHNVLLKEFGEGKLGGEPRQKCHAKSKKLLLSGRILKKYRLPYKMRQFGLTYKMLRPKESKEFP